MRLPKEAVGATVPIRQSYESNYKGPFSFVSKGRDPRSMDSIRLAVDSHPSGRFAVLVRLIEYSESLLLRQSPLKNLQKYQSKTIRVFHILF